MIDFDSYFQTVQVLLFWVSDIFEICEYGTYMRTLFYRTRMDRAKV